MGMVIVSAIVCIYYNVIVAWTIYYLFMSFRTVLPWSHCQNTWNTEHCVDGLGDTLNKTLNATMGNSSEKLTTASEEFWEYVYFQFYLFLLHCSLLKNPPPQKKIK
jgi:solute carrier family 6 amino acid transporter-like protein 5/7/9/14